MPNGNLLGTVKGPGLEPNEYVFITRDNQHSRIGEFVFYEVETNDDKLHIFGTIKTRHLIKSLPSSFFDDPSCSPAVIASLIGMENQELYEVVVENIGYYDYKLKDFVNPRIQPNPGDPIYIVPSEMLADIICCKKQDEIGGVHIGSLLLREEGEVPIVLAGEEFTSTHLAILASTGSGKSYTAGVLIEELMSPQNRAAVLIVDPHNEYHTLTDIRGIKAFEAEGYKPEVCVFTPDKIKVRLSSLTEGDLLYLLPEGTSDKMRNLLSRAYHSLWEKLKHNKRSTYSWQELYDEVQQLKDGSNESSIEGLKWRIESRFGRPRSIFSENEHIPLHELFRPGRCTILQLSGLEENEQQVIVATILRRANEARMKTKRDGNLRETDGSYLPYPIFILLEEAHRFAPASKTAVSTGVLKQILSEGRKFGVGIGLISQRPGKLDQDVLSQCTTQIIMRIVNPVDQATIAQSVESIGQMLLDELPALSKGQAIIAGSSLTLPVLCRIRQRYTRHGGESPNSPKEWIDYFSPAEERKRIKIQSVYMSSEKSDEDVENFGDIPI